MPNTTVAVDRLQTFEILLGVPSQISLNQEAIPLNHPDDPVDLLIGQVFGA
jgi:hypothetical protein